MVQVSEMNMMFWMIQYTYDKNCSSISVASESKKLCLMIHYMKKFSNWKNIQQRIMEDQNKLSNSKKTATF